MKQANKKLLGITAIGLSAWLLVIALVVFNNTTMAMLTNDPIPASKQATTSDNTTQPRTLGATTDTTNAPVATLTHEGHTDATSSEIAQAMNTKKTISILPFALTGATLLIAASVIAGFVVLRKHRHIA